jgi:hypothetical protein
MHDDAQATLRRAWRKGEPMALSTMELNDGMVGCFMTVLSFGVLGVLVGFDRAARAATGKPEAR